MPVVYRNVVAILIAAVLVMAWGGTLGSGQSSDEGKILQTAQPLTIDGSLADWVGIQDIAVDRTPEGRPLAPSAELAVTAQLAFDAESFYAGVKVTDDVLEFSPRRPLEGDAFYITFVEPQAGGESRRYSTYRFSLFRGQEIKALTSRNGKANPPSFVKDIQVKIKPAQDKKSVIYEVAIPWRYIPDFRPFLEPVWGINLAYVDYDAGSRKTVQLVSDAGFSDALSALRKGRPFRFVPAEPSVPEFQSMLNGNHYFPQDEKTISLAIHSPAARSGWQAILLLSSPEGNVESKRSLAFGSGMSVVEFPIELAKPVGGAYDVSLGLLDEKGALRFSDDKQFFLVQPPEFEAVAAKIAEAKKGELYAGDAVFRESLPTLEVRLKWTEDFMKSADRYADIDSLRRWNEEIKELLRKVEAGQPALFPPGRAASLGYRSPVDGSLKSYAVAVPEWYDKSLKFPLLVTLGGGIMEAERSVGALQAINYSPRVARRAGDLIVMEPATELATEWYAGNSGQEIMAAIDHLKKIYSVNEKAIVLDGFDRGAYGALRWALLNPGVFRGVALRSGRYIPPEELKAENLFDLFDRAGSLSILLIHGAEDEIAPVTEAKDVAARLGKLGSGLRYIEVKDGGHADYDRWSDFFGWLKDVLRDAVVTAKPPKKPKEKPESYAERTPEGLS